MFCHHAGNIFMKTNTHASAPGDIKSSQKREQGHVHTTNIPLDKKPADNRHQSTFIMRRNLL